VAGITNTKPSVKSSGDALSILAQSVIDKLNITDRTNFIPTGLGEQMIEAVGCGEYDIVNFQTANKCGKTTHAVLALANIFWDNDPEYFDYPLYNQWKYKKPDGQVIKRARIIGTPQNVNDIGTIREEIVRWFPKGRYTESKGGKPYYSRYETDTGWFMDVMTYEQPASEFEGILCSLIWTDEPPPPHLIGAITSRFSFGGLWLSTQSPVNAGSFVSTLKLMEEKGTKVKNIYGSIYDNSTSIGIPNKKGTKRGLLTTEQIEDYKRKIPPSEHPARLEGKCLAQAGKVYPQFDKSVHVREVNVRPDIAKTWNCFCVIDPHDKAFPAIQWWAVTPPDIHTGKSIYICYNEYPTINTLSGWYYEHRKTTECQMTPSQIATIIKVLDGRDLGFTIVKRGIDPRFAKNTEQSYRKGGGSIVLDYAEHGIKFDLPQLGAIEHYRNRVSEALYHDNGQDPQMYFMPHCQNSIKAMEEHYWIEGQDKESETYKDFIDCTRMFMASLHEFGGWKPIGALALELKRKSQKATKEPPVNPFHTQFNLA
jgi:hypothetical protein